MLIFEFPSAGTATYHADKYKYRSQYEMRNIIRVLSETLKKKCNLFEVL